MATLRTNPMLDIREVPPRDRHPRIFSFFDSLGVDGGFVLVNDHEPKPLLYQFQNERRGQFEWSPLEEGPEVWRILISRRATEATGRSVYEYLQWDHARLDTLMEETLSLSRAGKGVAAASMFAEFRTGLLRHIRMEEEVLFPAFEEVTGFGDAGPTRVMRIEHMEIQGLIGSIVNALSAAPPRADDFESLRGQLLAVLGEHNAKEEQIVYPMTDRGLAPAQRDELIRVMQVL